MARAAATLDEAAVDVADHDVAHAELYAVSCARR